MIKKILTKILIIIFAMSSMYAAEIQELDNNRQPIGESISHPEPKKPTHAHVHISIAQDSRSFIEKNIRPMVIAYFVILGGFAFYKKWKQNKQKKEQEKTAADKQQSQSLTASTHLP